MWLAYSDLKLSHRRPSDDLGPLDDITAWCIDKTVIWFGITIENALAETREVGFGRDKRREAKYELDQLLDPAFRMPRPLPKLKTQPVRDGIAGLMAMAGESGGAVKVWGYVGADAKPS